MRRAYAAGLAVLLALVTAPVYADDDPASPPAGITPVHEVSLTHVLAMHDIAVGTWPAAQPRTRTQVWAYQEGDQSGTQTLVESGDNYRTDTVLGPFHTAGGTNGGTSWEQNANGLVHFESGIHRRDDVNAHALAHALEPHSGVQLIGEVTEPVRAYVVKVAPKDGRVEYVYYDASTYLIVRDERATEGRRIVRTYDDFRVTSGLRQPWHMHESNGLAKDDRDWKTQSLAIGQAVAPAAVAVPASKDPVSLDASSVTLPAKISGDRIVVTVQLGAHKVNLQMDSGASGILLNRDVGDATGVKSFGARTEVTAGQYLASDAMIPKIDFGVAAMENVSAETAPYSEWSYGGVPIAGLLGYDFIAGAVIHVDYFNGTVQAIAPASFTAPAGAIALPIRLDDGVPVIEATIGSTKARNFIVDTGADRSMIFSGFADAHSSDLNDNEPGDDITAALPFMDDIYGVGGKVKVKRARASSLTLGTVRMPDWLFYISSDAPSFEGDDYDGLIGQDVLRNFDVYFDYSRTMLYLVPNQRYRERWGS